MQPPLPLLIWAALGVSLGLSESRSSDLIQGALDTGFAEKLMKLKLIYTVCPANDQSTVATPNILAIINYYDSRARTGLSDCLPR